MRKYFLLALTLPGARFVIGGGADYVFVACGQTDTLNTAAYSIAPVVEEGGYIPGY